MYAFRSILAAALVLAFIGLGSVLAQDETTTDAPANAAAETAVDADTEVAADTPVAGQADADDGEVTWGEAFVKKLREGGPVMIFLGLVSIFGVGFAIERLVNLRRARIVPEELSAQVHELWTENRYGELRRLTEKDDSTLARVYRTIVTHRNSGLSDLSMMAGDTASRDLKLHLQRAYPLAVVATIAPLLGLLGTVIGLIGAFDVVSQAGEMGDPALFSADISEALITTATGLSIAVPALALYHYFRSRINLYGIMLEDEVTETLSEWFGAENTTAQEDTADEG